MATKEKPESGRANGATVGYEAQLWQMADALRGSMDAAEYKHVVLGSIYGQKSNYTTWRLVKMNLAIREVAISRDTHAP